jgi:hypothetical protein
MMQDSGYGIYVDDDLLDEGVIDYRISFGYFEIDES